MKHYFIIILFCLVICFCTNKNNRERECIGEELHSMFNDSLKLFEEVIETRNLKEYYEVDNFTLECISVPKDSFIRAIKRNGNNISFFNKFYKINEFHEDNISFRDSSILRIGEGHNFMIYLRDIELGLKRKVRNYFLENKVGNYYVIKKIEFENKQTILWNYKTGDEHVIPFSITTTTNPMDSLIFYSSDFKVTPTDATPICFLKLNSNKIDTLFLKQTQWWAELPFFDNKEKELYYIHSYYDNNLRIISTFAKMKFRES